MREFEWGDGHDKDWQPSQAFLRGIYYVFLHCLWIQASFNFSCGHKTQLRSSFLFLSLSLSPPSLHLCLYYFLSTQLAQHHDNTLLLPSCPPSFKGERKMHREDVPPPVGLNPSFPRSGCTHPGTGQRINLYTTIHHNYCTRVRLVVTVKSIQTKQFRATARQDMMSNPPSQCWVKFFLLC